MSVSETLDIVLVDYKQQRIMQSPVGNFCSSIDPSKRQVYAAVIVQQIGRSGIDPVNAMKA